VGNKGVFFLNSQIRYDDVTDGTAHTIYLGEKLREASELGWMSGTRATLRNAGHRINPPIIAGLNSFSGEDDEDDDAAEKPRPAITKNSNPTLLVGGFGSKHNGGANFAFGDGSVRFIKASIASKVFRLLASRADGELVGEDHF
jgi:prepilin-type processing-associated H-X9-DG protein